ncbi:FAD-dependent oxidoreductase, partial [Streptosporangium algeriense]
MASRSGTARHRARDTRPGPGGGTRGRPWGEVRSGVMEGNRCHVVVVGGGIAGLAAAWYLRQGGEGVRVTVLDGARRIGGKLFASEVA